MPVVLTPLGTGSAVPTRHRHVSAAALTRESDLLLFDCGEGTQQRLIRADLRRTRLRAIFITHLHGDHFYGLPGLLSTLGLIGYDKPITIVGPENLQRFLDQTFSVSGLELPFEIHHVPIPDSFAGGDVYTANAFTVRAEPLEHRMFCVGYRFEEATRPGKVDGVLAQKFGLNHHSQFEALKRGETIDVAGRHIEPHELVGPRRPGTSFAYCFDTQPCPGAIALARGADLLYHDATFGDAHTHRAAETMHSTARQAATVAHEAGARKLLLGHFSARYREPDTLVREASEVFPHVEAAEELKPYEIVPREAFAEDTVA
ncbi:MAG: ribonuclease Z [Bacteroidota bacterium]